MNIKSLQGPYKHAFMNEEEIKAALKAMVENSDCDTKPISVKEGSLSKEIAFQERHLTYLKEHPKINPEYYLSNLKTMIRLRP